MKHRRLGALALCVVLTVAVSACGDSSGSSGSSGSTGSTGSTGSATASKEPVTIYAVAPVSGNSPLPDVMPAIKAAAAQVNAAGGLGGRELVVKICDTANDPNTELQCVRTATSSDAVAMLSQLYLNPAGDWNLINAAKLPTIPISVTGPQDGSAEYSFPLLASDDGAVGGAVVAAAAQGCKAVAGLYSGAFASYKPVFDAGIAAGADWNGVKVVPSTVTPVTVPDWTPYVQKAVSAGADCIVPISGNQADVLNVHEAANANPAHPIVSTPGFDPPQDLLKSAGTGANGLLITASAPSSYATSVPTVQQYRDAIAKYQSGEKVGLTGVKAWADVNGFINVAKTMDTITRASLAETLNASTVETGLTPVNFKAPPVIPSQPRVKIATQYFATVQDGKVVVNTKVRPSGSLDMAPALQRKDK